jgi:hypothetical protein
MSKNSKGISRGKGMKFTEQHKQNISKSKTGCKYPNFKTRKDKGVSKNNHIKAVIKAKIKPIIQLDLEGNFIKQWNSIKSALEHYKGDIQACCAGKQKTSVGFIWKYAN